MLDTKGNKITFFGHSTFSLTTQKGEVALLDSWVTTNPKCPEQLKKMKKLDAFAAAGGVGRERAVATLQELNRGRR